MLEEIMRECKNFFPSRTGATYGRWEISGGTIGLPFVKPGQYFRLTGSDMNDGVYQYPPDGMADETFDGYVLPLSVPPAFLRLVEEIEAWQEKNGATAAAPFSSESFNGYSYTKAQGKDGGQITWQDAFRTRLAQWRCL